MIKLGDTKKIRRSLTQKQILVTFLAIIAITVSALFYLRKQQEPALLGTLETIEQLGDVYRREGMERYLQEKESLKRRISAALKRQDNSENYYAALSVALYLFPEVLGREDFERDIALEDWAPLQKAIEKSPRTPQSRALFEEMRANIWNYENASREAPQLSSAARQAIRIYELLSTP